MLSLFKFFGGTTGRIVEGIAGSLLIMLALFWVNTTQGAIVGVAGLTLLACGVFDFCAWAPLFGFPLNGPNLRKEVLRRQLRPHARSSSDRLYR